MCMKVLMFSHEYPPDLGGAGSVAMAVYEVLKSKGCSVELLNSTSLPFNINKSWPFFYKRKLELLASSANVIILNDPVAIYCAGKYLSAEKLSRCIAIIHGKESKLERSSRLEDLVGFEGSYKRAFYNSGKVVFVSNFLLRYFDECYGMSSLNSHVIHNGVAPEFISTPVNDISQDNDVYTFITVARMVKEKGFDSVLELLSSECLGCFQFKWLIVGAGNYEKEFKRKIQDSVISDRVEFLGPKQRSEVIKLLDESDCYILLSKLEESFGLGYLEASARGVSCVGIRAAGIVEAFEYVPKGFLLDPGFEPEKTAGMLLSIISEWQKTEGARLVRTTVEFMDEILDV